MSLDYSLKTCWSTAAVHHWSTRWSLWPSLSSIIMRAHLLVTASPSPELMAFSGLRPSSLTPPPPPSKGETAGSGGRRGRRRGRRGKRRGRRRRRKKRKKEMKKRRKGGREERKNRWETHDARSLCPHKGGREAGTGPALLPPSNLDNADSRCLSYLPLTFGTQAGKRR